MNSEDKFEVPTVTDADICRASHLLGLSVDAFYGIDGADPRQAVLKCMDTVDVAACPGSGKTTLLVAKLAILAEKWQYRTRGICVLSHTNAARHEIEKHLGNTPAGRQLLGYPHYIGTIHGFVNEFLALPWLRSLGYPIKMIDTEVCRRKRWYSLPVNTRYALKQNHHGHSVLSVKAPDFGVGQVRWGKGSLGVDKSTYVHIKEACRRSAIEGYFCYDEMFMWAEYLIDTVSGVADVLRNRFPILLIDEAQDNGKEQSAILSRIFMEGDHAVIRQRFGDSNQAIYDFQGAEEAATDKFPGASKMELPNSYRFGQTIADIADPLGLDPCSLQGLGPKKPLASGSPAGQHTIFLFDENSAAKVLDAYGELLLDTFSDLELHEEWFAATAVGQRHRPPKEDKDDKDDKFPHHVGHYWLDYDPELTKHDPIPWTFMQYVFAGQGKSQLLHETHAMVEKIAEGFLRLSEFKLEGNVLARRKHAHRHILQLLENSHDIREQYQNLIVQFTVKQERPNTETWEGHWRGIVRSIAEAIAGSPLSEEADDFLMWHAKPVTPIDANRSRNNIFRYCKHGREVSIQAGSIHSVKGQTHTATLVLETFWHDHNLELILPWLTQKKRGWKQADGSRQEARLKLHYVAMTRPKHLLCLAMKRYALSDEHICAIRKHGWQFIHVQPDGSTVVLEPALGL